MTKLRILCVHESDSALESLGRALQMAGYESIPARDGQSALRMMESERVAGIVLDYEVKATGGRSLRYEMQHLHPDVPMLLFSDVEEIRAMPLHVFGAYLENTEVSALALVE